VSIPRLCYLFFLANKLNLSAFAAESLLKMHLTRLFPVFCFALLSLASRPVEAAMNFCNRTQHSLQAAFGYHDLSGWISEGWWRIEPGQCARIMDKPLTQRFYFYYGISLAATDKDKTPAIWNGKYQLCIDIKAFHIEGDGDCEARHYHTQGFQEIDIGSTARDYTFEFKD
jgi:uncharacterized membrane protein